MRRIALLALAIGFLTPFLASAPAHAQATRTWVSGVGDDANPCSRTAPCKTFAGAISKTAAAGEINCLDPGGFGAVTITKSITLNCHDVFGSVLVSGTNAININAATTDRVILRNLQIQGVNSGLVGVKIFAAAVVSIEDCVITQFAQQGISDSRTAGATKLFIRNTVVSHNVGDGISIAATAPSNAEIENTSSINNLTGVSASGGSLVMVRRSVFSGNATGISASGAGGINIDNSAISNNGTGVTGASNIRVSNSDVTFNTTGFSGTTVSYGNNRLQGNTSFGTAVSAAGAATSNLGEQ
jgi:hypothetical protein